MVAHHGAGAAERTDERSPYELRVRAHSTHEALVSDHYPVIVDLEILQDDSDADWQDTSTRD